MNKLRPIVALTYLVILFGANIAEVLPGDSTGGAFSYRNEAKAFVGCSIMLSLFQIIVSINNAESENEKRNAQAFEWFIWAVASVALIAFMIYQQKGADPNRLIQLAILLPVVILTFPRKHKTQPVGTGQPM
ncbi:MAG: hypothetical protein ACSHYA_10780 [Opitutaceae bacterium]